MIKLILAVLIVIAAIGGFSSCEKYSFIVPKVNPADTVYFQSEVQPIFNAKCISCHGAIKAPDLRDGKSYEALTEGGYVDQPGNTSELYLKMTGSDHAPKSSDIDKQTVLIWINQGARDN